MNEIAIGRATRLLTQDKIRVLLHEHVKRAKTNRQNKSKASQRFQETSQTDRDKAWVEIQQCCTKIREEKVTGRALNLSLAILSGTPYQKVERATKSGRDLNFDHFRLMREYTGLTTEAINLWLRGNPVKWDTLWVESVRNRMQRELSDAEKLQARVRDNQAQEQTYLEKVHTDEFLEERLEETRRKVQDMRQKAIQRKQEITEHLRDSSKQIEDIKRRITKLMP